MKRSTTALLLLALPVAFVATEFCRAQKYDPGASDAEIKIGGIMPYSGAASSYSAIGKVESAYFEKINAEGGINGRKIKFVSYDDASSAPKTVEQARKLVEGDEVLLIFNPLGTAGNTAIQKYMNAKKVPQLFVATGATKFGDPAKFPYTMGWQPTYRSEARVYAKEILAKYPDKKIAVLWQNDDAGKDLLNGLREGLREKAGAIVANRSYELTDPTVDSQIAAFHDSQAEIFLSFAAPKATAQALKKIGEIGWHPIIFIGNTSTSIPNVMIPAGRENTKNVVSTAYLKDPEDPAFQDDEGVKAWRKFLKDYAPGADEKDTNNVFGYAAAQTLVQVLKQCGDELTRENVMRQAAHLQRFASDMMLPGITVDTSPTDYFPIEQLQLQKFDGTSWHRYGQIVDGRTP